MDEQRARRFINQHDIDEMVFYAPDKIEIMVHALTDLFKEIRMDERACILDALSRVMSDNYEDGFEKGREL